MRDQDDKVVRANQALQAAEMALSKNKSVDEVYDLINAVVDAQDKVAEEELKQYRNE
jgi:hypothetical protein